jgi:hypothetical protein
MPKLFVNRAILSIFVAGFFVPILSANPAKSSGRRLALLVGINQYRNRNLEDLEFAENDVRELYQLLRGKYQARLLLGSASGRDRATRKNIEDAIDQLLAGGLAKEDTVLIALSGHGVQAPATNAEGVRRDEPFYLPVDGIPGDPKTLVNLSRLMEKLAERGGGANLVLIDACRNDPDPSRGRGIDGEVATSIPKGMAVFFSCSRGEKARESEKAGSHGLFFYFVLQGLRSTETRNGHGDVTWERLVNYVKEKMEAEGSKFLSPGTAVQVPHDVTNLGRAPVLLTRLDLAGSNQRRTTARQQPDFPPPNSLPPTPAPQRKTISSGGGPSRTLAREDGMPARTVERSFHWEGLYMIGTGANNKELWRTQIADANRIVKFLSSSDHERLFVLSDNGLSALDATNGKLMWRTRVSSNLSLRLSPDGSEVIVGTPSGGSNRFDARTGARRSISP